MFVFDYEKLIHCKFDPDVFTLAFLQCMWKVRTLLAVVLVKGELSAIKVPCGMDKWVCYLKLFINFAFCCVMWSSTRKSSFIHFRYFKIRTFASEVTIRTITGRTPPPLFPGTLCVARMSEGLSILQKFSLRISFGCSCQSSILILHFCEYCWLKFATEMACRTSLASVLVAYFQQFVFLLCNVFAYIC